MIHIRCAIFTAIATCIVLLAYYLSQQWIDLELPISYIPLQGKPFFIIISTAPISLRNNNCQHHFLTLLQLQLQVSNSSLLLLFVVVFINLNNNFITFFFAYRETAVEIKKWLNNVYPSIEVIFSKPSLPANWFGIIASTWIPGNVCKSNLDLEWNNFILYHNGHLVGALLLSVSYK
jgi:hypothetical protein